MSTSRGRSPSSSIAMTASRISSAFRSLLDNDSTGITVQSNPDSRRCSPIESSIPSHPEKQSHPSPWTMAATSCRSERPRSTTLPVPAGSGPTTVIASSHGRASGSASASSSRTVQKISRKRPRSSSTPGMRSSGSASGPYGDGGIDEHATSSPHVSMVATGNRIVRRQATDREPSAQPINPPSTISVSALVTHRDRAQNT